MRACPCSANVLLRTQDGGLRLTATNLEIGISAWVPGKIEVDGALTVPARLIADIVAGLPAGERVDLEVENEHDAADPGRDASRRTCAASTPTSSRSSPRAVSGPPRASARSVLRRALSRGHVRSRDRRDPADPHGRADPIRGRGRDAGRGRQLPHRGEDAGPALVGRGDLASSCPRARMSSSCASSATPTSRSTSSSPRRRTRSSSASTRPRSSAASSTASSPTTSRCCRPRTARARSSTATSC